jgi:hypothetical protein
LLRARRAPIIYVFVPSRNNLAERGTVLVFRVYASVGRGDIMTRRVSDGTPVTRVGLRKHVAIFFPLSLVGQRVIGG